MMTNGKVPRCSVPDCFSPIDYVIEDIDLHASLKAQTFCERHYRSLIIEPLEKQRNRARLEAERLARQIEVCNTRIKQAKVDYHVVEPMPYLYCVNKDKGCDYKIRYTSAGLVPRDAMQAHLDYNCKKRKGAPKPKDANPPRVASKPKAPQGLTEDDLT